jgi:hypothetical protein
VADPARRERTSRVVALAWDAIDPLARSLAAALAWKIDERSADTSLIPTDGTRFGIRFLLVADASRPRTSSAST